MIYHEDALSFRIVSAGRVAHRAGVFSVKARPYAAFALRLSGSVTFRAEGKSFSSQSGDVTFIPDGVPYEAEYTDGESLVLHLSHCSYHACENIKSTVSPYLKDCFREMIADFSAQNVNGAKSVFYRVLSLLAQEEKKKTDEALAACLSYMEKHFRDPSLSLLAVARAGFISVPTLRRKCTERLGIPPKEHIIRLRLSHAVSLLYGGASVREAAKESGFSDEKFFARTVKLRYGVPPSALRYG